MYNVCQDKKYGVADQRYFKKGNIINVIFSEAIKATFYLTVYGISTPHVRRNLSYELENNDGSNGT